MLQDDERKLSIWLANRIDSRRHAREAAFDLATMQADVTTVPLLATVPGELRER